MTLKYHVFENIMENGALHFNIMFVLSYAPLFQLLTLVLVKTVWKTPI